MRLTARGEAVVAWIAIVVLTAVAGAGFFALMKFGDNLQCERLRADTSATEYTTNYYCNE